MKTENKKLIFDRPLKVNYKYCIKKLLLVLYSLCFKPYIYFRRNNGSSKKYLISICACFKDECDNLKEWIEYHRLIGFDHFYLYNNNSNDRYKEVLTPYISEGIVTLIDFPLEPVQPSCYEHCIKNYRKESSWLTFIDIDEFFVPLKDNNIKDWLGRWDKYPVIIVYWKMFGTSGLLNHDKNKLKIEQYTSSWPKLVNIGKIIFNTDYEITTNLTMHHYSVAKYGKLRILPVNQWKKFVFSNVSNYTNDNIDIQLNHYWSGAYNLYSEKHQRGFAAGDLDFYTFNTFLYHEQKNTSVDYSIYKFLIQMKLRMSNSYPIK